MAAQSRTRIYAFVHIANIGLSGFPIPELYNIDYAQVDTTARAIAENADIVLGVTAAWFVTGSALFALLPVVALRELDLGPSQYGWVLALLGGIVLVIIMELLGRGSRSALWVALGAVIASSAAAFWLSNVPYAAAPFAGQFSVTPAILMAKGALLALAVPVLLMSM